MLIIGERINTSRKLVNEAVANRDAAYIEADVTSQVEHGADLIDVNAGSRRKSEVDDLIWLIEVIQNALPELHLQMRQVLRPGGQQLLLKGHVLFQPPRPEGDHFRPHLHAGPEHVQRRVRRCVVFSVWHCRSPLGFQAWQAG